MGYPFPVQTRWSYYGAGTPNVVVTAFAVAALVEAAEILGVDEFAARGRCAAAWVLDTLYDEQQGIFVYHPGNDSLIHNANLLGARGSSGGPRLASGASSDGARDGEYARGAAPRRLMAIRTGTRARVRGFLPHRLRPRLPSLVTLGDEMSAASAALERGSRFYLDPFFGSVGEARLWPDKPFPEDAHSAGTALSTIAALAGAGIVPVSAGAAPARRILTTVLRGDHCTWRRYRCGATRVHYPRWCDAHVALGLASYALVV